MNDDEMTTPADNSRVGFRDIYRAVGESEARIVATVREAIAPLATASADHEARLRSIEAAVAPLSLVTAERDRRIAAVETLASLTAADVNNFKAREGGILSTLGAGKSMIIVGMGLMGTLIAAADWFSRLTQ